jgi:hypothetical protein
VDGDVDIRRARVRGSGSAVLEHSRVPNIYNYSIYVYLLIRRDSCEIGLSVAAEKRNTDAACLYSQRIWLC